MPLIYNTDLETEYERNRIVFGAPGTGKSFNLKRDCEEILNGTTGSYERVTFHPDYTYSQFVGTYKPVSDGATIRYEFVPGPFMRVYVEAMKNARTLDPQPYILIIEEINRAKVAAVFGDVFQLLDRDDVHVDVGKARRARHLVRVDGLLRRVAATDRVQHGVGHRLRIDGDARRAAIFNDRKLFCVQRIGSSALYGKFQAAREVEIVPNGLQQPRHLVA